MWMMKCALDKEINDWQVYSMEEGKHLLVVPSYSPVDVTDEDQLIEMLEHFRRSFKSISWNWFPIAIQLECHWFPSLTCVCKLKQWRKLTKVQVEKNCSLNYISLRVSGVKPLFDKETLNWQCHAVVPLCFEEVPVECMRENPFLLISLLSLSFLTFVSSLTMLKLQITHTFS